MNNFENIPQELKALPQWVCFCYEGKDGRKTKVLKIPGLFNKNKKPVNASSTKPESWRPYQVTTEEYQKYAGIYDGIGFVLKPGGGYVFIDIDKCVNDNGRTSDNAQQVIDRFSNTYIEKSVSGKGYHILCKGCIDNYISPGRTGSKTGKTAIDGIKEIEVYQERRFLTFTGNTSSTSNNAIAESQVAIDWLFAAYPSLNKRKQKNDVQAELIRPCAELNLSDSELVERIRRSQQGGKFSMLYDYGDISSYANDDSRADAALAELLAWWTQDAEQIRRIMSASALTQREKWQKRKDYQDRTINEALSRARARGSGYNPQEYAKQKQEERYKELKKTVILADDDKLLQEVFYYELSDAGNAERVQSLKGTDWLYCSNTKSWYKWDGRRWQENDGSELTATAVNVFRLMKSMIAKLNFEDEKLEEAYMRFFTKSCNAPNITRTKAVLADLLNVDITTFDTHSFLLNTPDGTLNLMTGEKHPHNKAERITKITGCSASDSYHGSLWEKTLTEVLPDADTREYFQRFCGYCLSGDTSEEKFVIAYGGGGKGKGTLLETIAAAMGDYAVQTPVELLLKSKTGNGETPAAQLLNIRGKHLVLCSESGLGRKLDEAKIKWLTGGDTLTARGMYAKKPTTWQPTHKIIIQSNYLPHISDATDEGIGRRLIIIPFNADIAERDTTLKGRLRQQEELQHVMSWMLEGYQKWQSAGLPEESAEMKLVKDKFYADNDLLSQWFVECCDIGSGLEMPMKHGKESYNDWLTGGKTTNETVGLKVFSAGMESHGFCKVRKNTGYVFTGIALKNALTAKKCT